MEREGFFTAAIGGTVDRKFGNSHILRNGLCRGVMVGGGNFLFFLISVLGLGPVRETE